MWADYEGVFYEDFSFKKTIEIMTPDQNYKIHENCEIIGDGSFHDSAITKLELPEKVNTIEIEAFADCKDLQYISFNNNLKNIEQSAFASCSSLGPNLILPQSLNNIGKNAFAFCSNLKNIDIGGIKNLVSFAFYGCYNVTNINLQQVETIGANILTDANIDFLILPETLKEIDAVSFGDSIIKHIKYEGTKNQFLDITGANAFYKKYQDIIEFEPLSLEKMLSRGKSISEINESYKRESER